MKILAVILSIITLTLSAIPCDDDITVNTEQLTSISQSSDQSSHEGFDLCSPFCSCVCCTGIVLQANNQQSDLISEISTKELNTYYSPFFSSSFHTQIFQPPQV